MPEPTVVVLVGSRAVGKTTVGRALARRLGWSFVDADARIADRVGEPAGAFLRRVGEAEFRRVEEQVVLAQLATAERSVFALGGGAVLSDAVRAALLEPSRLVVHLHADAAEQVRRRAADAATVERPALTELPMEAEIRELDARRAPLYAEVRDLQLDSGRLDADGCVAAIADRLDPAADKP